MYPHERSLVEEMQGKPFALLGVNSDSTLERARKAVEENDLNWRSFQNSSEGPDGPGRAISDRWRVQGWPTIVVLDETFTIRYRGHDGDQATEVARELVAELGKK